MATINVRENRKVNQKWTIQKYMQYLAQCIEQRQAKQKTQQKKPPNKSIMIMIPLLHIWFYVSLSAKRFFLF